MSTDNRIQICNAIAKDMKDDAANFDGQPFTGKTVGTYMGYHGAAIASLAELVKSILEEKQTTPTNQ